MRVARSIAVSVAVSIAGSLLVTAACRSHERSASELAGPVSAPGVLTMWANDLDDDGDKFDVSLSLRNDSADDVIVRMSDLGGSRGDVSGAVRKGFFGAGEKTIDLGPGQTKTFRYVCNLPHDVREGPFRVIVHRVFANPSHDRKTLGDVLAGPLVWETE